jgi:hypothetical protein
MLIVRNRVYLHREKGFQCSSSPEIAPFGEQSLALNAAFSGGASVKAFSGELKGNGEIGALSLLFIS